MVSQAIDWLALNENETVLDLFCGIGNFSVPIAKYVKHVLAVEGSQVMTKQVLMNAHANGLSNIEAYCHNLIEPLDQSICHGHEIDAVLLDPPRAGASECMPWLMALRPKRILYVSCQSSTFARDARMLVEGGYRLARMGLMDMFPHTKHVESIAVFVPDKSV